PGAGQHNAGQGRQFERREEPGDAGAQYQGAVGLDDAVDLRLHGDCRQALMASIRSMGAFARSPMSAGTITSCVMVWSEWRIPSKVMRFICGHRLQGRTNSTSGCSTATLSLIEHSVTITTRCGLCSPT